MNDYEIASIVRLQRSKLDISQIDLIATQLGLVKVWRSMVGKNQT